MKKKWINKEEKRILFFSISALKILRMYKREKNKEEFQIFCQREENALLKKKKEEN